MRPAAEAIALVPERTADPLEHVDYRLAETPEDKDRIYRLRYRAYLREGAILPSESERVSDRYDDLPNNFTFGVYVKGELYSSIRISVLTSEHRGSPSSEMFTELLHPELDRGKVIVDPTRFVADPEKARTFPELPYVTVRLGYIACGHFNADIGLANVRPEHRAFYRKVFLQEPWGEPKLYPGLINRDPPAVLTNQGCASCQFCANRRGWRFPRQVPARQARIARGRRALHEMGGFR